MHKDLPKKIVFITLTTISAIFLIMLIVTYAVNEEFIRQYNEENYWLGYFNPTGFTENYIYPYNLGCSYYEQEMYAEAEKQFKKALDNRPPETDARDCKTRINLGLSIVKQLDLSNVTEENVDFMISRLEDARDMLCENGCADMDDEYGHSDDAQRLKDEIDALIEQLKNLSQEQQNQNQNGNSNSNSNDNSNNGSDENETDSNSSSNENETDSDSSSNENETDSNSSSNESETDSDSNSDENESDQDNGGSSESEEETLSPEEQQLQSLQDAANQDRYEYNPDNYGYDGGSDYSGPRW